jgi:hypothetical protein
MDMINDHRRIDNCYQVRKHKNSKTKQIRYRIERSQLLSRTYMKKTFLDYDERFDGGFNEEFEPDFYQMDDCTVWDLGHSPKTDDIDRLKLLLLYTAPTTFKLLINVSGRTKRYAQ